jgi:hypothetical protein
MSLCLINHHEDVLGQWMNSATHSYPWHWMEVSGQQQSSDSFLLRNSIPYQLDISLGGPQSRSGQSEKRKISVPTSDEIPIPRSSSP